MDTTSDVLIVTFIFMADARLMIKRFMRIIGAMSTVAYLFESSKTNIAKELR